LALLTGAFLHRWCHGNALGARLAPRLAFPSLALTGIGLLVALPFVARKFLPGEELLGLTGIILLIGAVVGYVLLRRERIQAACVSFAVTAVAFTTALFGFAVLRVDHHQQIHTLLAAIDSRAESPRVGAYGRLEPTWIFYGGRPIDMLHLPDPERADQDVVPVASGTGNRIPNPRPSLDVVDFFRDGTDRFIITTDHHWEQLRDALPSDAEVLHQCPLFLKENDLLLIGRASDDARLATRDESSVR
jgi:hypothetical protein